MSAATITTSDNTAGNLILDSYGGPAALTAYVRQLGDEVTRLDRNEPALNRPSSDGLLDTTRPRAMALVLQKLWAGDALSPVSRQQLAWVAQHMAA
ncbi:MAG: serine hydrolase [Comamonas sp.]|nr:serine hydrolase [Comamonas sp.]